MNISHQSLPRLSEHKSVRRLYSAPILACSFAIFSATGASHAETGSKPESLNQSKIPDSTSSLTVCDPITIDLAGVKEKALRDFRAGIPFVYKLPYGFNDCEIWCSRHQQHFHNNVLDAVVPANCVVFTYGSIRSTAIFNVIGIGNDSIEAKIGNRTFIIEPGHVVFASRYDMASKLSDIYPPTRLKYRDIQHIHESDNVEIFKSEYDVKTLFDCNKAFGEVLLKSPTPKAYAAKLETLLAEQREPGKVPFKQVWDQRQTPTYFRVLQGN